MCIAVGLDIFRELIPDPAFPGFIEHATAIMQSEHVCTELTGPGKFLIDTEGWLEIEHSHSSDFFFIETENYKEPQRSPRGKG